MKKRKIVIIGAGAAGLSAALQAVSEGGEVVLVSSQPSERAQSVMAEGGINAAMDTKNENDSPEEHYKDTINAACGLADPNAVWNMTQAAPDIIRWLMDLGVQFNRSGFDEVDLRNFGGQKKKRTVFAQSDTGKQLTTALIDAVRKEEAAGNVKRLSHHSFQTLLLQGNVCLGCLIKDEYSSTVTELHSDAVIIASGGMHGLFGNTTGSLFNTGEVTAELFRLGIPIANGEMIQYHPTTIECGGKRMLITEAVRAEGGKLFSLKNGKLYYFMRERYPELGDLMPRDINAREIWKERQNSEVFLDMTDIPDKVIAEKLSGIAADCMLYLHKDIRKEPVPVSPGIHYFMGGILVDEYHRTQINGLYAAGECCSQYHGANRLGGNSLLGAIYGGKTAARYACSDELQSISETPVKTDFSTDISTLDILCLNRIMQEALSVVRNEETLQKGLREIKEMSGSLALLGRAIIESAIARRESRGAHYREDYPLLNDRDYLKTTVARFDGDNIRILFENVPKRR